MGPSLDWRIELATMVAAGCAVTCGLLLVALIVR